MNGLNLCCCFTLSLGAVITGWFGVIGGVLCLLLAVSGFISPHMTYIVQNGTMDILEEHVHYTHKDELFMYLFCGIMELIVSGALLYGVKMIKKFFLLPWLVTHGIFLVIFILTDIILIAVAPTQLQLLTDILEGMILALFVYIWVCILSLYLKYNKEGSRGNQATEIVNFLPAQDEIKLTESPSEEV